MSSPYQSPQPVTELRPQSGQAYRVPPKPVGPIIFGVLSLAWGALGLFGTLAGAVSLAVLSGGAGAGNPMSEQMLNGSWYGIFLMISMVLGGIFAIVLLVAGVGMLKTAPWGRTLSLVYAVYNLVMGVVGILVNAVWAWQPATTQSGAGATASMVVVFGIIGTCIGLVYPLALLVYCLLPSTKQLFARPSAVPPPAPS